MIVPIYWLSRHEEIDARGPWDTGLLERLFARQVYPIPPELEFQHALIGAQDSIPQGPIGIVVVPARHHSSADDVEWINVQIGGLGGVLLILCGDEEAGFPWKQVRHENIRFWVQMPDPDHYADMPRPVTFFFGNGWRYEWPDALDRHRGVDRDVNWAFAGQVTNVRRKRCANGLRHARPHGVLVETPGFSQGLPLDEYASLMEAAWVAPCPGGPKSVDTFRLYEALEAGAIPIIDCSDGGDRYWDMVYPDWDEYLVGSWDLETIGGEIEQVLANRYHYGALAASWWQQQKRAMTQRLCWDITRLCPGRGEFATQGCVAVVTTSPVPGNPDLGMIQETIESIPPLVDVYIACDGVRPEQAHLRDAYQEFVYRLTHAHLGCDVVVLYDGVWRHQAGTTRAAVHLLSGAGPGSGPLGDSRALLFMEHDTPLVVDEPIDFSGCLQLIEGGHLDVIRFHHESHVLPDHEYLMVDHSTQSMLGVPIRRTRQWSQRPHLASLDYYYRILREYFRDDGRTMIEDRMHSVCQGEPYERNRLAIYHPDGNIKRSYHLDGRGDEPKWDMVF